MNIWYRGAALAGAILLWASVHVGAQIRETVGLPPRPGSGARPTERSEPPGGAAPHPRGRVRGRRADRHLSVMLQRLDPAGAVERASPPSGVDGIIAYPGSRMLAIRGTREAVAGYRAALEKLDRAPVEAARPAKAGGAPSRAAPR